MKREYGPKLELVQDWTLARHTRDSVSTTKRRDSGDITCFFVDRNNRRRGVAGFGLNAALASIKKKGGGIVEAYPSTNPSQGASLMWSGTVSMFEEAGFAAASQLGKSSVVMRKIV